MDVVWAPALNPYSYDRLSVRIHQNASYTSNFVTCADMIGLLDATGGAKPVTVLCPALPSVRYLTVYRVTWGTMSEGLMLDEVTVKRGGGCGL